MKYNILEYSQEEVLKLRKTIKDRNDKEKEIRIDIIDLHILHLLSDFMNRKKIIKYIVNDKTYFSVQYKVFLEDLPILDIKQQALTDRLDKLAMFGLIEKVIIKNQLGSYSAFRLGEKYEDIKYFSKGSDIRVQTYQTTSANVANYEPKDYSTNNYSTNNNNKEIKDKSSIKKSGIDYDYIMQQWHEICSMLPAIRDINDKRKKNIANTLRNNKATVDDLIKCFRIMSVSSFCRGEGSKNWIATFDWLISDTKSCFNRILEGEFNKKPYEHKFYEDIMQDKEIDNDNNNTINLNGVTYR